MRFRAADGFSHARSLAFVTSLLLVQGVIVLVGLAAALGDTDVSATIVRTINEAVPGPAGKALTDAVFHAYATGRLGQYVVLVVVGIAALITGTTLMGQMERALNRLYGIEQDRPTLQKYGRAFVLALTRRRAGDRGVRDVRVRARHRRGIQRRHGRADLAGRPLAHRARAHGGGDRAAVPVVAPSPPAGVVVAGVRIDRVGGAVVAGHARARALLPGQHDVQHAPTVRSPA